MLAKPKQVQACKRRRATLVGHLDQMEKVEGSALGGVRVEATVTSPTLHMAIQTIAHTPVLNIAEYIGPTHEEMQPYKIRSLRVSKEDYLANLRQLLSKAEEQEVFAGHNQSAPHPDSQQIIIDLFNALGWHTGRFEPTRWNNPGAWWLHSPGEAPVVTAGDVAAQKQAQAQQHPSKDLLKRQLRTMEALRAFYNQVKGQLTCPKCSKAAPALFNQGGRRQFRLQCKGCKARFNQDQAREYFGQLLDGGQLILPASLVHQAPAAEAGSDVVTEDDDTDMPDLGSSSDSSTSGSDQAPVHPLHGPRRQSSRLRAYATGLARPSTWVVADEAEGPRPVVLIPACSSPPPPPVALDNDLDPAMEAILEELALDLAQARPQPAPVAANPAPAPVAAAPAQMPSSQPLDARPNLRPVHGLTGSDVAATLRALYNLKVSALIARDGNCMFRAMSYHLTGSQSLHMEVRKQAINWLKQNPDILLGFAAQGEGHFSAPTYLANMARPGEWGDEIMLMAISQAYNVSILVSSGRDPETGDFNVTIYPHNATGPHYGLCHIVKSQHYELLFP